MAEISDYIKDRVDDQIAWHSSKALYNKRRYDVLQIVIIIAGSVVPLVNVIDSLPLSTRIVSAGLGALITIITSITQLKKYGENRLSYRNTAESLKKDYASGSGELLWSMTYSMYV